MTCLLKYFSDFLNIIFLINCLKSSLHILDKKVLSDKLDSCKPFGPHSICLFHFPNSFRRVHFGFFEAVV